MEQQNFVRKYFSFAVAAAVLLTVTGCWLPRNPVPLEHIHKARLPGLLNVRSWSDRYSPHFQKDLVASVQQETEDDFPLSPDGHRIYSALALSGGGADGAFGAGFMCGWTQAGTRPNFKIVTGISTGALIAPFVFAGPEFDERLKLYTKVSTKDLIDLTGLIAPLWSDSFVEGVPLAKLLRQCIDDRLLTAIAAAHNKGRRLYIGTTNLDAEELVVWNMGAIADSNHPDALGIFRKVMLASASIPGALPPVYFEVEVNGEIYDELHVDGGVTRGVFLYGFMLDLDAATTQIQSRAPHKKRRVYVIRNGKLAPSPHLVTPRLVEIIPRAIYSLTKANAWGDLYRIYAIAQRDNIDFNYAFIPDNFVPKAKEVFDPDQMNQLFDLGFNLAASGYEWSTAPPGLENTQNQR